MIFFSYFKRDNINLYANKLWKVFFSALYLTVSWEMFSIEVWLKLYWLLSEERYWRAVYGNWLFYFILIISQQRMFTTDTFFIVLNKLPQYTVESFGFLTSKLCIVTHLYYRYLRIFKIIFINIGHIYIRRSMLNGSHSVLI